MQPLDPVSIPLRGWHLIEASAGTGKTYAITGLYIRLLLERDLPVAKILVVTYTEAACQELRDKLRARLLTALRLSAGDGAPGEDPFLAELWAGYQESGRDLARLRALLTRAALDFDLAAVFTIHGFCMRALQNLAFESGTPFVLDFIEDDQELLQQVIDDYWRRHSPSWPPALVVQLLDDGLVPDCLPERLAPALRVVQTRGLAALRHPAHRAPETIDPALIASLADLWRAEGTDIRRLLVESPALSRSETAYRQDVLEGLFGEFEQFFIQHVSLALPLAAIKRLGQSALTEGTKKTKAGQTPRHPFFTLADRLRDEVEEARCGLILDLIRELGPGLTAVKERAGVVSFDDLLTRLRAGLRDQDTGPGLAARLFSQYPVALIDEFQDTDPVQYEIFSTIYQPEEGGLFLVGDPKQAIYGFRGADIFSYLKAASQAASTHTLGTNWRSEPGLVKAFNQLFASHPQPFLLDGIDFFPVASPKSPRRRLVLEGLEPSLLTVFTFEDQEGRNQAKTTMARWLARRARRLLALAQQGHAYFEREPEGEREPLRPGDIAVLVRNHREAQTVKEALAECGLRAVTSSRQGVFATPEAGDLTLLLEAVAAPGDERRLRRALATRILGYDLTALAGLADNLAGWDEIRERFAELCRLWLTRGPAVMLNRLLATTGALPRLASQPDGERRLTNLRHLLELLQEASETEALGLQGLIHWLAERRRDKRQANEVSLLRLESDENLLKIVTIHKSKGLQYPVVLAPFLWDSSFLKTAKEPVVVCHDDTSNLFADLGSAEQEANRLRQRREALAEELRLLYVALTRAENRCLVFWCRAASGKRSATASSPLQYLFSGRKEEDADLIAALEASFKEGDQEAALAGITAVAANSDGVLAIIEARRSDLDETTDPSPALTLDPARAFSRALNHNLGLRSFSGLQLRETSGPADEVPDHDGHGDPARPLLASGPSGPRDMFGFPRGPEAGSCLHAILEAHDFQEADPARSEALAREKLTLFGLDPGWADSVRDLLARLAATPLAREGDIRLGLVGKQRRVSELEFYYPLPPADDHALRAMLLRDGLPAQAARGRCGFMKGFIDLVFEHQGRYYLVDYKSNYLGPRLDDYGQAQMAQAMNQAGYHLQGRIYALALHRYLGRRLTAYDYERHFGGCFYLFLRGLAPERGPECGVYFFRPERQLLEGRQGL